MSSLDTKVKCPYCGEMRALDSWCGSEACEVRVAQLRDRDAAERNVRLLIPPTPAHLRVPYPADEELKQMFPIVDEFAKIMRQEMWANRRKGDRASWLKVSTWVFWTEVQYHAAKLAIAVKAQDIPKIREHSADTANMVMMLADTVGLLDE